MIYGRGTGCRRKIETEKYIHLQQEILVYTLQGDTSTQAPRKEKVLVATNHFEICFLQGKFFTCKWLFT